MKNNWEKEFMKLPFFDKKLNPTYLFGYRDIVVIKSFIRQKLIEEYRKGYNDCIEELEIKNDYGEKSL